MTGEQPTVTIAVTGASSERESISVSSARRQSMRSVEVLTVDANAAVERASGDYVFFLGAGNVLDRHACRTAVAVAESTGADIVVARWERDSVPPASPSPHLFRRTMHYLSVDEQLELIDDTRIGNKLFRMDFLRRAGLRFHGAGATADAHFVMRAYALARGITVIPHRLYVEHAAPPPDAPDQVLDAAQALDLFLAEQSTPPVRVAVQVRFLQTELPTVLNALRATGADNATATAQSLRDHLVSLAPEAAADAGQLARTAVSLAARDDLDGLRMLADRSGHDDVPIATGPHGRTRTARTAMRRLGRAVTATGPVQVATRIFGSGETKSSFYRHLFVRLPQKRRSVVFESHMGQSFSDNPRYIFEELRGRDERFDVVWSFADDPPSMPAGVRTVRRSSWRYYLALARARYWVDNQGLPATITKPSRTTYLQTWHGSALKKMGADTPGFRSWPEERRARHRAGVARWDYFLVRSEHDVRTLVPALEVAGEVLRYGYPRNDPLVQLRSTSQRDEVREQLGLPVDAVLVLYAPTFRETYAQGRQRFTLPIDLDNLRDELPDHLLLVRTHYLQRMRLPAASHAAARDVSHVPDITPLMAAADVLVTDYSSVMFDFANTGRPMVFYVYDYEEYANDERGVYWDLETLAPGPLVRTSDELIQALATVDTWREDYQERYRSFVSNFGEYDKGDAARRVVDHLFFGAADDQ